MKNLEELQKTQIKKLISDKSNVDLEKITDDSNLKDNLGIDSLDVVEIIMELEQMFSCTIPDEDYEHTMTVNDIFKVVEQNL